ncbi:type II secretion system F family protein [Candidatus Woesearchaeota archaeon]|nr:type II secretion system F family protein [Candidatus Woesearchaeota archaeon]
MKNTKKWGDYFILAEDFGKAFIPDFVRPIFRRYLEKAGIYKIPYTIFGVMFYISVIITGLLFAYLWPIYFVGLGLLKTLAYTFIFIFVTELILALVMMGIVYVYIDVQIFQRTKEMEDVLADFLSIFNDNLKTGMTLDKALWRAIKPEFGVLSNEIKIAAKRVMTGDDIVSALEDFVNKYDSITLRRAFSLITESMRGGGEISYVIDKVIDDIKKTTALKERMIANTISYTIFITAIVLGIAPSLFSLSYYLLSMIDTFSKNILSTATLSSVMGKISIAIALPDFITFSRLALMTIAFFAAMIVSIINKGDIRGGIKYIPMYVFGAYIIYSILMVLFGWVFSSFVGSL